ncbi:hypothetical protein HK104_000218 [Borealophlyctis nickersoniae]|nr:hypothetical protein HK104_000218 [Borealophlyctis nickersoniae]
MIDLLPQLPELKHIDRRRLITETTETSLLPIRPITPSTPNSSEQQPRPSATFSFTHLRSKVRHKMSGRDTLNECRKIRRHFHDYTCHCVKLPMEILNLLTSFVQEMRRKNKIDQFKATAYSGTISAMCDCLVGFERILSTPTPLAYNLHLKHTVILYVFALPFQLVDLCRYWTIAAVAVAAFTLLGIDAIGAEIENPFGQDPNDLPMDAYCTIIRDDVEFLLARPPPRVDLWDDYAETCVDDRDLPEGSVSVAVETVGGKGIPDVGVAAL